MMRLGISDVSACVIMRCLQLNRKVKILESDLEQTEDALDEKRQ